MTTVIRLRDSRRNADLLGSVHPPRDLFAAKGSYYSKCDLQRSHSPSVCTLTQRWRRSERNTPHSVGTGDAKSCLRYRVTLQRGLKGQNSNKTQTKKLITLEHDDQEQEVVGGTDTEEKRRLVYKKCEKIKIGDHY